ASFSFTFAPVVVARAENGTDTTKTDNTQNTNSADKKSDIESQKQRIEQLKQEQKEKIQNVDETRIKARCKAAQGLVAKTLQKTGQGASDRVRQYEELQHHLTDIIAKLKAKGIDTAT